MTTAPDYLEPVSGWRCWVVDVTGPSARLRSIGHEAWPVGQPLAAACRVPETLLAHPAPGPGCDCGIHAARRAADAACYVELPSWSAAVMAIGLVGLWGRVIEGRGGWRARFAYPQRLYVPCRRLAERPLLADIAGDLGE